ncbi:MAG: hypothetical protein Kow0069_27310 [Promethearchaeota archaeon]
MRTTLRDENGTELPASFMEEVDGDNILHGFPDLEAWRRHASFLAGRYEKLLGELIAAGGASPPPGWMGPEYLERVNFQFPEGGVKLVIRPATNEAAKPEVLAELGALYGRLGEGVEVRREDRGDQARLVVRFASDVKFLVHLEAILQRFLEQA